jgi:4'-phosphopantetheinyl transferase
MTLQWLLQESSEVEPSLAWLTPLERHTLAGLRFNKRRQEWLVGRWATKCALAAAQAGAADAEALAALEIVNDPEGAPSALRDGSPLEQSISISHRDGAGLCTVAPEGYAVGCDLELVEPHGETFEQDYFDAEERERIARSSGEERERLVALLWSAKESALKALGTGLRRDTRELHVELLPETPAPEGWHRLRVSVGEGDPLEGWWRRDGPRLMTCVTSPPSGPPVEVAPERQARASSG